MKAKARKSCPNCRRLQALLDAQEARLKALEATVALRRNSPRRGRIPRPPPSRRPPTSSSRPSRTRRRVKIDAASGDNRVTPSTNAPPFRPESINGASVDYRLDLCPCCGILQPMPTILPRVIQQVDVKDVPLEIQEHRGHPGGVLAVRSSSRRRCPSDRTRRVGRAQAHHRDCLPRGGLPRFVLHRPELHSRRSSGLTLSRGQLANIIAKVSERGATL